MLPPPLPALTRGAWPKQNEASGSLLPCDRASSTKHRLLPPCTRATLNISMGGVAFSNAKDAERGSATRSPKVEKFGSSGPSDQLGHALARDTTFGKK